MTSQEDNVIIIGAGASGIIMACQLQRQLGFTNFEIYEKGSQFGGTWHFNTYPGCGCDIPSHFYSFSFEKKPDWTQVFPLQPEIHDYMLGVCKKYNLGEHAHFNTECLGAEWDKATEQWTVSFKDLKANKTYTKNSKFLVLACGGLSTPNPCPVPGIENFKGEAWHSARWNHKVSLENKDVVVIGNGCSAAQFVPAILPQVKTVTQFIRSQHWILERPNWNYSSAFKWVMRYVPGANAFHRFLWAAFLDIQFVMFKTESGRWMRDFFSKGARKYMKSLSPEKYHDLLIPKFQIGSKRRIFDSDYLKCLHDPKILLTDDPLVQIKEKTVLTKSGKEYPADVIVYANGFQIHKTSIPVSIKGKSGEDLRARWERQGGMRGYMGVVVADFPNMFAIIGPNTASGHYSIIYMAECNVNLAIRLMKPLLNTRAKGSVEVTEEAEKRDVDWVQTRLKDYIWHNTGESGWYVDKKTGHNGTVYPHFQSHYWLRTLNPKWEDFKLNGAKKPSSFVIGRIMVVLALIGIIISWLLIAGKVFNKV